MILMRRRPGELVCWLFCARPLFFCEIWATMLASLKQTPCRLVLACRALELRVAGPFLVSQGVHEGMAVDNSARSLAISVVAARCSASCWRSCSACWRMPCRWSANSDASSGVRSLTLVPAGRSSPPSASWTFRRLSAASRRLRACSRSTCLILARAPAGSRGPTSLTPLALPGLRRTCPFFTSTLYVATIVLLEVVQNYSRMSVVKDGSQADCPYISE
jgi:hypothetical protein